MDITKTKRYKCEYHNWVGDLQDGYFACWLIRLPTHLTGYKGSDECNRVCAFYTKRKTKKLLNIRKQ